MKNRYLIMAILLFILLMIPYFQNFSLKPVILFYSGIPKPFLSLYLPILFLGMLEGVLIFLAVQKFIDSTKQNWPKKFDLN